MEQFFVDYLNRFEDLAQQLTSAIEGLPLSALDWSPAENMNSITVLVTHLTGATRFLIGDIVLGEPSGRVRSKEFESSGLSTADLLTKINTMTTYIQQALPRLTTHNLSDIRPSPVHNREFSIGWALLHAMEHAALHVGQVQITRQMWEQSQGDASSDNLTIL